RMAPAIMPTTVAMPAMMPAAVAVTDDHFLLHHAVVAGLDLHLHVGLRELHARRGGAVEGERGCRECESCRRGGRESKFLHFHSSWRCPFDTTPTREMSQRSPELLLS